MPSQGSRLPLGELFDIALSQVNKPPAVQSGWSPFAVFVSVSDSFVGFRESPFCDLEHDTQVHTSTLCCRFCCGCPIPCRVTVNGMGGLGDKGGAGGAPEAEKIER